MNNEQIPMKTKIITISLVLISVVMMAIVVKGSSNKRQSADDVSASNE